MIRTSWVLALVLLCISCGNKGDGGAASGKPKVVVSIFPIYDLTKRIAGDRLNVMLVLPAGKSEHGYDPTPQEMAALHNAKLGIAVGLDMDGWVESIMKSAKSAAVFRLGEKLPTIPIDVEPITEEEAKHEHGHEEHGHEGHEEENHEDHAHAGKGAPDPHVWLDPHLMQQGADLIAEQLATVDPAGKDTFVKNAAAVKTSLAELDKKIAE